MSLLNNFRILTTADIADVYAGADPFKDGSMPVYADLTFEGVGECYVIVAKGSAYIMHDDHNENSTYAVACINYDEEFTGIEALAFVTISITRSSVNNRMRRKLAATQGWSYLLLTGV